MPQAGEDGTNRAWEPPSSGTRFCTTGEPESPAARVVTECTSSLYHATMAQDRRFRKDRRGFGRALVRTRTLVLFLLPPYLMGYLGTRHSGMLVHRTAESHGDVFHHVAVGEGVFPNSPMARPLLFLLFYPGVAAESIAWALMDPGPKHERKEMMIKGD